MSFLILEWCDAFDSTRFVCSRLDILSATSLDWPSVYMGWNVLSLNARQMKMNVVAVALVATAAAVAVSALAVPNSSYLFGFL